MISDYQLQLRERFLAVPETSPPAPWGPVLDRRIPIGGLLGIGFAVAPDTGHDLVMVISVDGHGLFDTVTGEKIARDHDPVPDDSTPDAVPDLSCPGLGPITGTRVAIAGLFGGGLHTTTLDGWSLEVVSPEWPHHRVLLSTDGGQRTARRTLVAYLRLQLLRTTDRRLLTVRTQPRSRHQQRPHPMGPAAVGGF